MECDAQTIDFSQFIHKVDLLAGGPPCQPFSTGGLNAGPKDPRNMFPVFLDAIRKVMPKAFLIENVRGLVRAKFQDYFDYILKRAQFPYLQLKPDEDWQEHLGRLKKAQTKDFSNCEQYDVTYHVVDTADYGVPQRRERVLIVGFRRDIPSTPFALPKTHTKANLMREQWVTGEYWIRHRISPEQYSGPKLRRTSKNIKATISEDVKAWRTVRDAISDLPMAAQRGSPEILANHTQHPGARGYRCHTGSYYDFPAKALKAGTHGTPGGENMLRISETPDEFRYFTTREAARLHTFPDGWRFIGTWGSCIKQLGNAVPVILAQQYGSEIHRILSTSSSTVPDTNCHRRNKSNV